MGETAVSKVDAPKPPTLLDDLRGLSLAKRDEAQDLEAAFWKATEQYLHELQAIFDADAEGSEAAKEE